MFANTSLWLLGESFRHQKTSCPEKQVHLITIRSFQWQTSVLVAFTSSRVKVTSEQKFLQSDQNMQQSDVIICTCHRSLCLHVVWDTNIDHSRHLYVVIAYKHIFSPCCVWCFLSCCFRRNRVSSGDREPKSLLFKALTPDSTALLRQGTANTLSSLYAFLCISSREKNSGESLFNSRQSWIKNTHIWRIYLWLERIWSCWWVSLRGLRFYQLD